MVGDRRRQRDYDGDYYVDGGLLFSVSSLAASNIVLAVAAHSGLNTKNPPEMRFKKIVKTHLLMPATV